MSIISHVGGSATFGAASGGKVYAYNNLGTTAQVLAPANPYRRKITFINPGIVNVLVGPAQQYLNGSLVTLNLSLVAAGGGILVVADGGIFVVEGECQIAWQGLAVSGANNPFTVIDTNIG